MVCREDFWKHDGRYGRWNGRYGRWNGSSAKREFSIREVCEVNFEFGGMGGRIRENADGRLWRNGRL